jgi:hypothetical protein
MEVTTNHEGVSMNDELRDSLQTMERIVETERRVSERRETVRLGSGRRHYEHLAAQAHYARELELAEGYAEMDRLADQLAVEAEWPAF